MKRKFTAISLLILSLVLAACYLPGRQNGNVPLSNEDMVNTAAAKTVSALGTLIAAGQNPTLGGPLATSTATPAPTQAPSATDTPLPQSTASPTATSAAADVPCNRASFVRDVTIPDNSTVPPNTPFTKTWELKNTGSCTWTTGYSVVFAGRGSAMSAAAAPILSSGEVKPGDSVQVSVGMRAPDQDGDYEGYWELRSADNQMFGTGEKGAAPFFVKIHVADSYSFSDHMCSAQWSTGSGTLPCPGKEGDAQGYILKLDKPNLEDHQEREGAALLTGPQPVAGGYIVGHYPAVIVPDQADFRATLSCKPDANGCYVHFKVTYQVDNGDEQILGEWNEGLDGGVTTAVKDLDMVSGKATSFSLYVYVNGDPNQAKAIWFDPRIVK